MASLMILGGCISSDSLSSLRKDNDNLTLFVGAAPDMPPVIYRDHGSFVGIEADFARKLAAELQMEIKFIPLPRDKHIIALEQGSIDIIMSGLEVTSEDAKIINYCKPYMNIGLLAVFHESRLLDFPFPKTVFSVPRSIGVEKNSDAESFLKEKGKKATVKGFRSNKAAIKALAGKKVDVVILPAPAAYNLIRRFPEYNLRSMQQPLTKGSLAWAIAKGNEPLLKRVDIIYNRWVKNGTIRTIVHRHFNPVKEPEPDHAE